MNTVFKKCGSKFAACKLQQAWKRSFDRQNIFKFAVLPYCCSPNYSNLSSYKCNKTWTVDISFLSMKSLNQQTSRQLTASKNRCWKCNAVVIERDLVCISCGCVQEPKQNLNYFEIFKETPNFDIDIRNLTVKFRRLQTLLHPDKIACRSREEQEYSLEQSIRVNRAYQILIRPMERAKYILELNGNPILEEDTELPPDFLADIMEVNEMLEDCQTPESLETIRNINDAKLQKHLSDLSLFFKEKNYIRARDLLLKLRYFVNIDNRIKKMEDDFGITRDD